MYRFVLFLAALFVSTAPFAGAQLSNADNSAVIAFAQKTSIGAVNCRQGDLASLTDAQADFTADGWKGFMKHMEGFLDAKGAPTFSATFTPSRNGTLVEQKDGVAHVRIPGTLKQTQNQSGTTYRAALEVYVAGTPMKIQRLEQITCAGASKDCQ